MMTKAIQRAKLGIASWSLITRQNCPAFRERACTERLLHRRELLLLGHDLLGDAGDSSIDVSKPIAT